MHKAIRTRSRGGENYKERGGEVWKGSGRKGRWKREEGRKFHMDFICFC